MVLSRFVLVVLDGCFRVYGGVFIWLYRVIFLVGSHVFVDFQSDFILFFK